MNGLVHVMQQLHSLWHRSVVEVMFAPVLANRLTTCIAIPGHTTTSTFFQLI